MTNTNQSSNERKIVVSFASLKATADQMTIEAAKLGLSRSLFIEGLFKAWLAYGEEQQAKTFEEQEKKEATT